MQIIKFILFVLLCTVCSILFLFILCASMIKQEEKIKEANKKEKK